MSASVERPAGLIRLLPPEIANKIAAGEVVQRPASVLKELLDNAIDAGASEIRVLIQQAGRLLVQVVDNGSGMPPEDLPNCFLRHATSKISSVDDLLSIRTLGFRGEAMASIASIAQVTVKTKRVEDAAGHEYEIWGGEERTFRPVATPNGTSVAVRNLFFNVPARRAFLKSDVTEMRHLLTIFQQMALANPAIGFELADENESLYRLPAQDLPDRIAGIFGKSYKPSLLPIDERAGFVRIHGFVTDPKLARRNRGEQFLFVNGRPFMHRHLTHVVLEEYRPWLREDAYPFFCLFYDLDPELVDVNVHPSKMEVRFEDERTVAQLTRSVVKRALNRKFSVPEQLPAGFGAPDMEPWFPTVPPVYAEGPGGEPVQRIPSRINLPTEPGTRPSLSRASGLWQLHDQFICAQTLTGLLMVDQHAAHKRILYERALEHLGSGLSGTQQLLFPVTIEFSASDFALLRQLADDIRALGFDVQLLSGNAALVSGVPADIASGDERNLLASILQQYQQVHPSADFDARQRLAMAFASKTAIPRGKRLAPEEMDALIDQLFACKEPYLDPNGKAVTRYWSVDDLRIGFR